MNKQPLPNIPFFQNLHIITCEELSQGQNNQNFKVATNQGTYFLKICHQSPEQAIDRHSEYQILEKVYRAGIGVKPLAFDAVTCSMVLDYVQIPLWTFHEIQTLNNLKQFGQAIRTIHDLSPIAYNAYIGNLLDRYWQVLHSTFYVQPIIPLYTMTRKMLDFYHREEDMRFCHNDLCYGHFFKGQPIVFVDWEIGGMNDLYSDLAGFIHFHQLNDEQTTCFLQSYTAKTLNKEKLVAHKNAILLRELLWVITKLLKGETADFYQDYYQRCLKLALKIQQHSI